MKHGMKTLTAVVLAQAALSGAFVPGAAAQVIDWNKDVVFQSGIKISQPFAGPAVPPAAAPTRAAALLSAENVVDGRLIRVEAAVFSSAAIASQKAVESEEYLDPDHESQLTAFSRLTFTAGVLEARLVDVASGEVLSETRAPLLSGFEARDHRPFAGVESAALSHANEDATTPHDFVRFKLSNGNVVMTAFFLPTAALTLGKTAGGAYSISAPADLGAILAAAGKKEAVWSYLEKDTMASGRLKTAFTPYR